MYPNIIMVLCVVLAIVTLVSIIKNLLINFNGSDNGWITALAVVFSIVCLLSALAAYSEAYTLREINFMIQPSTNLPQVEVDQLKSLIPAKTRITTITTGIGYVLFFLHVLTIKGIRKAKLKQIELNANNHWNLKA